MENRADASELGLGPRRSAMPGSDARFGASALKMDKASKPEAEKLKAETPNSKFRTRNFSLPRDFPRHVLSNRPWNRS
jgi:hypothetical protein